MPKFKVGLKWWWCLSGVAMFVSIIVIALLVAAIGGLRLLTMLSAGAVVTRLGVPAVVLGFVSYLCLLVYEFWQRSSILGVFFRRDLCWEMLLVFSADQRQVMRDARPGQIRPDDQRPYQFDEHARRVKPDGSSAWIFWIPAEFRNTYGLFARAHEGIVNTIFGSLPDDKKSILDHFESAADAYKAAGCVRTGMTVGALLGLAWELGRLQSFKHHVSAETFGWSVLATFLWVAIWCIIIRDRRQHYWWQMRSTAFELANFYKQNPDVLSKTFGDPAPVLAALPPETPNLTTAFPPLAPAVSSTCAYPQIPNSDRRSPRLHIEAKE